MHGSLIISVAIFEDLSRILEEIRTTFDSTPGFRCVHAGREIIGKNIGGHSKKAGIQQRKVLTSEAVSQGGT